MEGNYLYIRKSNIIRNNSKKRKTTIAENNNVSDT